ncbi:sugar lyase [Paenibacillus alba]|uniref:chondroitinase family polysaccharide lyase n=1 Tax=Paenibacillus alba TaxID=1197127 RepID=UPI0015643535|nr:chondroitinase family polysaccharide lyase [Paenibacillus alba]NQX66368.1 sugar lyase [Paenibacillus alba]
MRGSKLLKKVIGIFLVTNFLMLSSSVVPLNNQKAFAADDYSNTESFEAPVLPPAWTTENGGSISLSNKHFKQGSQSMAWTWSNHSKLRGTNLNNLAAANTKRGGMKIWIYNETPIADEVTFNFGKTTELDNGIYHYSFKASLNFKGWRTLWIRFREEGNNPAYTQNISNALQAMQVVPPNSVSSGTLYIDSMEFSPEMITARTADYQMPKPGLDVGSGTWDNLYYYSQKQPTIPLEPTITQAQITSFQTISNRYEKWVLGDSLNYAGLTSGPLGIRYDALKSFISAGLTAYNSLNIKKFLDGTITGEALYASRDPHLKKFGEDVSKRVLLPLVFDYKINGNASSKQKVIDVLNYMNDQGWAFGSALGTQDHETNKNNAYFHTVYLMRNELKAAGIFEREMKTCNWFINFGKTFESAAYEETTSDEYRTKFMYNLLYVLGLDNTPTKVQYMKELLNLYNLQIGTRAPGYADVIKPDGTLFHHRGTYMNAYGNDAIHMGSLLAYFFSGTSYALSENALGNLKKALLTMEKVSNTHDMAIGATGRFPDSTKIISDLVPAYAYLALARNPVDEELAKTFMRLWDPNNTTLFAAADSYGVAYLDTMGGLQLALNLVNQGYTPKANPQGFWVLPYSGMAVNRVNDRMVSLKGWSQYVWDFESTNSFNPQTTETLAENLYGRYQSYGNMEVLNSGGLLASGINTQAGWDWSRWPGTTVKHLSLEELAYPLDGPQRSFTDKTFTGGTALGNKYGVFAMDLHDTVYDTSFRAKKSTFFFGDKVVALGSDITNSDANHRTETVLFQSFMPTASMPFYLNSINAITSGTYQTSLNGTGKVWMVDPYGTGYLLPNASGTVVTRGVQNSKNSSGSSATSGSYTTAYIDHGLAPSGSGYEYAMKLGAGAAGTKRFAENPEYTVLQKDSNVHIVQNTTVGQGATGYAIFNSSQPINKGALRGSTAPAMVMIQMNGSSEMKLSMSDPDLRLPQFTGLSTITAQHVIIPSVMKRQTLTIQGKWTLKVPSSEARIISATASETKIEFDCVDGKTIEVEFIVSA